MSQDTQKSANIPLWLEGVLTASVCVVIAVMSLVTRKPTPIDLVTVSSALTLQAGDEEITLPPFLADTLTIIGSGQVSGIPNLRTFDNSVALERFPQSPALSIQGFRIPPRARLTLRRLAGEPRTIEVVVRTEQPTPSTITTFVRGKFSVTGLGNDATFETSVPQAVRIASEGDALIARVRLSETGWSTQRPFEIRGVSFLDADPTSTTPDIFSSIQSGAITFIAIDPFGGGSKELRLRPGQLVRIDQVSRGFVRSLSLEDQKISLGLSAEVGVLETRWRDYSQDHMPSWLAFASSQEGVKEFSAAIFALLLILIRLVGARLGSR